MASSAAPARSTPPRPLQIAAGAFATRVVQRTEYWFEAERDQLPLWLPVAFGGGIAAWFALAGPREWSGVILAAAAVALAALAFGRGGRLAQALAIGSVALAMGCGLIWWQAQRVAAPLLARPAVVAFTARVERIEPLPARDIVRLRLNPIDATDLPPRVRVNLADKDMPAGLARNAIIKLRARLMPPPRPALPGAYDFARVAWFQGLGATGRGFPGVEVVKPAMTSGAGLRQRLAAHVRARVGGDAGAIAATLATGDRGAISDADAEAMRRSGLAHLLSISGLHVTAVVGATMVIVLRFLALFPPLALRVRLPLVAAIAGAVAAIGYTWLTGAAVPTIRSCVAALLVLGAIAMGREAVTLRLIAAGALIVLIVLPESLVGPSFQLSFAAVVAIVALHEHPAMQRWFGRREEHWVRRIGRGLLSLLLTGLAVEIALMPIALYHFHKAGLYGAAANIFAIPLTTFIVMPAEALALLFDAAGLGAPFWWMVRGSLTVLLGLAHATANAPGAVALVPGMPTGAFALMVGGGLWILLWRTRWRWLGLVPVAIGAIWSAATSPPDMLVTADGRHLAIRTAGGGMALLRSRSGDYVRDMMGEIGGTDQELDALDTLPIADCSHDACVIDIRRNERQWRILATRSSYLLPYASLKAACNASDIVVSDRWLPDWCRPRWLKIDRRLLAQTGGMAIDLSGERLRTTRMIGDQHPWIDPPTVAPPYRNRGRATAPVR